MINRKSLLGAFLFLLFCTFMSSGIVLIDVTFTFAPFTVVGLDIPVTVNIGLILIAAALAAILLFIVKT